MTREDVLAAVLSRHPVPMSTADLAVVLGATRADRYMIRCDLDSLERSGLVAVDGDGWTSTTSALVEAAITAEQAAHEAARCVCYRCGFPSNDCRCLHLTGSPDVRPY